MLSLEAAVDRLLARVSTTEAEEVALENAFGRVLAEPRVVARLDVPPFANSAMDGYAVRAADTPGDLRIVGESAAGAADLPDVSEGTAVAIMTGAPMPAGADAVVPVEEVDERGPVVVVRAPVRRGAHVRAAGHDTHAGDELCLDGELRAPQVAVLASLGIGTVRARRRPRVAVVSTGDELVAPGRPLRRGQIHDANGVALAAAVIDAGGEALTLDRLPDEAAAIEAGLIDAAGSADLVVASGGVSVGRHDHVRAVLERRGALDFWKIAVQPGKPLAVGDLDGTTVIGLPGNPVSALITFELFVRRVVRAMLGLPGDGRPRLRAFAETRMEKDRGRRAFLRVRVRMRAGRTHAAPAGGQLSSQLRPMADANALLVVPEGKPAAEAGEEYDAIVLDPAALVVDR